MMLSSPKLVCDPNDPSLLVDSVIRQCHIALKDSVHWLKGSLIGPGGGGTQGAHGPHTLSSTGLGHLALISQNSAG